MSRHATASDALWAGLPVLTCRGQGFAGRVAASQLSAIGLPELATASLQDYEALALRLARDPVDGPMKRRQNALIRRMHPDEHRDSQHNPSCGQQRPQQMLPSVGPADQSQQNHRRTS